MVIEAPTAGPLLASGLPPALAASMPGTASVAAGVASTGGSPPLSSVRAWAPGDGRGGQAVPALDGRRSGGHRGHAGPVSDGDPGRVVPWPRGGAAAMPLTSGLFGPAHLAGDPSGRTGALHPTASRA